MKLEDIKKGAIIEFNGAEWKIEDIEFGVSGRVILLCSPQSSKCNWPDDELKSVPAVKAELA
jgi:hypothetical protein